MSYYTGAYLNRLNRYGTNPQDRINNQRAREFADYMAKSIYKVEFIYNSESHLGVLEPNKQDQTQTLCYLLTPNDLHLPAGSVFTITKDGTTQAWIVWWDEYDAADGYARHTVIRANYQLSWTHDGVTQTQWAYFSGPAASKIKDTIASSSSSTIFKSNDNLYIAITPWNNNVALDDYFVITSGTTQQGFVVSEFDICSSPGIGYISAKPYHLKNTTSSTTTDSSTDNYWLTGGANGNS